MCQQRQCRQNRRLWTTYDLSHISPKLLKKHQIYCFGTHLKNSTYLESVNKINKFSVCFGNEARGMSDKITALMDKNIKIKMENDVESLNVLSASSIVMYHLK